MSNPPEDQILFAIGWMADSFARVEARIVDCFALLVNPSNLRVGELISDRLSLQQTLGLVGSLLENLGNQHSHQTFLTISKDVQKAAATRNDIMHSSWATPSGNDDTEWEIIQERARKRHLAPGGHSLEDLLAKMEEATFFIQDVEMKVLTFRQTHIEMKRSLTTILETPER